MAIIGKIRNNPLIVLLFIGGGVALFILSEMTSGGASGPVGPAEQIMGRVGGLEIQRDEFEKTLGTAFAGGDAFQNRDNLFQFYVNEGLIKEEANEIGLSVSKDELYELEFGDNLSPVVRQNFMDRQTGQMSPMLNQIKTSIDAGTVKQDIADGRLPQSIPAFWNYQRRQVVANRLQEKMGALVSKSMYAPKWQAQNFADMQIASRRVAVATVPFSALATTDVEVTDADIQAYIEEYRSRFNNPEASRQIAYVAIPVAASTTDVADISSSLEAAKTSWMQETTTRGDSLFALSNGGTYSGRYVTADDLSDDIATRVTEEMEEGDIYGPYREGEAMKLVKLVEKEMMADSANTRHILLGTQGPGAISFERADELADSLINVLQRNRRQFSALVEEFSTDPGSKDEGGVYEGVTPQQFVPSYDEVLFRTGQVGELYKVRTSYGIHVVEILSRARTTMPYVKVAYAVEPIIPGSDTEVAALARAQELLNEAGSLEALRTLAKEEGLEVQLTNPLPQSAYNIDGLGSGQSVKDMMCWAFDASRGEVSNQIYAFNDPELGFENNYVVAALEQAFDAGITPVDAVRENLTETVANRKKGQQLQASLNTLTDATSRYPEATIDTINVNPTLTSLAGIGAEPRVIAAGSTLSTGQTATVVGNTGIFIVQPITDAGSGTSGSLPLARQQLNGQLRTRAAQGILPALRLTTEVEDARATTDCR